VKIGPAEYSVTVSMGVTVFPQENVTSSELIAQADIAMYRAKESGRNTSCYFEPAMQEQIKERAALSKDLREALSHGDFRVFLQPQVDRTGRIIGAEALIRWQHQQGGLIAPAKFIPIAEDTGLIVPMGEFMLREACNIMRQLERADITFRISVNVSLRQFKLVDFAERIIAIVKASEINPASLTLEITESVLLHDTKVAIEKMQKINQLGIGFSIDDFGTGYSSLGYLQRLPLKELKIDRSFIRDVVTNPNDGALVEAILAIAHHHQLRVVAEGIETPEQFDYLKSRTCPLYQGYLFGRPIPAQELLDKLLVPTA
jgi:EAL domain-containing protein (putative c-di-GMP-specific phosphodiesterase class I)